MKAMVTGGTGFVGSHLVEALLREGHHVRVLKRGKSPLRWIESMPLEVLQGDVQSGEGLGDALKGVDWVFHLAGITKAHTQDQYLMVNAQGTRNLVEACLTLSKPPKKVVVVSSLAACGPSKAGRPRREEDPCCPVSHYGHSKLEAERIVLEASDRIPVVIVRPPAVYGPRDTDVLAFFKMLRRGVYMKVGGRDPEVSLIHVRDAASAMLLAARATTESGEAFFISDGHVYTWREVVGLLSSVMGVRPRQIKVPLVFAWVCALASEWASRFTGTPPLFNRQKLREMIQEAWTCEIQRARERLGFHPAIPLEKGLRDTYRWYLQHGWL